MNSLNQLAKRGFDRNDIRIQNLATLMDMQPRSDYAIRKIHKKSCCGRGRPRCNPEDCDCDPEIHVTAGESPPVCFMRDGSFLIYNGTQQEYFEELARDTDATNVIPFSSKPP